MRIFKTITKTQTGKRSAYHVANDGEQVALVTFSTLTDAALVARFLAGGNLSDRLTEKALELMEGGEQE